MPELTEKEQDLTNMLLDGQTHETIAEKLKIKISSLKTYISALKKKILPPTGAVAINHKAIKAPTEVKTKAMDERIQDFQKNMCTVCNAKDKCMICGFRRVYTSHFNDLEFHRN